MNDARAYRDGAQRVRTDARAKLATLRAERAAGKFRVVDGDQPRTIAPESPPAAPARPGFQPSARARAFAEASARSGAAGRDAEAPVSDAETPPAASSATVKSTTPRASRAAVAEARKTAKAAEAEAAAQAARPRRTRAPRLVTTTPVDAPSPETPATAAAPTSDLDTLPGAGPGLVWLLNNAGFTSLAELATADAEALRDKLGLIGLLVNLEGWIAFADASTRPQPPAKAPRRRAR